MHVTILRLVVSVMRGARARPGWVIEPALGPERRDELRNLLRVPKGSETRGRFFVMDTHANPWIQPGDIPSGLQLVVYGRIWPKLGVSSDGSRLEWHTGFLASLHHCSDIMRSLWDDVLLFLRSVGAVATGTVTLYVAEGSTARVKHFKSLETKFEHGVGYVGTATYVSRMETVHLSLDLTFEDVGGETDFSPNWHSVLHRPVGLPEATFRCTVRRPRAGGGAQKEDVPEPPHETTALMPDTAADAAADDAPLLPAERVSEDEVAGEATGAEPAEAPTAAA
jgi:hypothetical protein